MIDLDFGIRITKKENRGDKYPVYGGGGQSFFTDEYNRENEYVISRFAMSKNCVRFVTGKFFMLDSGFTFSIKSEYKERVSKDYLGRFLISIQDKIYNFSRGHAQRNLDVKQFKSLLIPLPHLEFQKQLVAEVEVEEEIANRNKELIILFEKKIKEKLDDVWAKRI